MVVLSLNHIVNFFYFLIETYYFCMPKIVRARWEFVFGDKKDAFLAQRINSQQALIISRKLSGQIEN